MRVYWPSDKSILKNSPFSYILDCIKLHRTVSCHVNYINLLIKYAIALRNHQLHTELSLWRLIFLPLVFFGFRKFWNLFPSARAHGGKAAQPGSAKKHLDTREFKQQQEALNNLILESEELVQNSRQILDALEQREEELKKNIEAYERQAEEAEKIFRNDSALPKVSIFNYQSVLKKASSIIAELEKALTVTHIAQM